MVLPFIPKSNSKLPDHFGMKIFYVDGTNESFDVASFRIIKETNSLELVTKDDIWSLLILSSIRRIEFDKDYSKVIAVRKE